MRASEWQFLCAVHEQPKSCCAIDYCCHTLDWAANVVTNPKLFPSRFVALSGGEGAGHDKNTAVKNLVNVFRRLHRIFAHAWFQHRGVFWSVEGQTGLYVFFKTVCDIFDTLPAENYKLPPEAEGLESAAAAAESMDRGTRKEQTQMQTPIIQQRSDDDNFLPAGRTNTRRHIRSSPSTGSAVTTVIEADEDVGADVTTRLKEMRISAPETVEEEPEMADVPVIVEHDVVEEQKPEPVEQEDTSATQPDAKPEGEGELSASNSHSESKEETEGVPQEEESSEANETEAAATPQDNDQDEALKEPEAEPAEEAEPPTTETEEGVAATISTHDFAEEKEEEEQTPSVSTEVEDPEPSTEEGKGNDESEKTEEPNGEEAKETEHPDATEEPREPEKPQNEGS